MAPPPIAPIDLPNYSTVSANLPSKEIASCSVRYNKDSERVPYAAKRLRGETFVVFVVFHSILNVFRQIMALSVGNVRLQACYRESFPTNGNFVP